KSSSELYRRSFAQHFYRASVRLVGGRDTAIERDQQQDLADLLGRAAVLERALEMDAQLCRLAGCRHHRDHRQALGGERQSLAAPDIAVRIRVDEVLQRRPEFAERVHALLDRGGAEHLTPQSQTTIMKLLRIHRPSLLACPSWRSDTIGYRLTTDAVRRPRAVLASRRRRACGPLTAPCVMQCNGWTPGLRRPRPGGHATKGSARGDASARGHHSRRDPAPGGQAAP